MTHVMRAKMRVNAVAQNGSVEQLQFSAVPASEYPQDGSDEDNTFAKFTPSANMTMVVANPDLHGKFAPGDTFYVDFTQVEQKKLGFEEPAGESDEG